MLVLDASAAIELLLDTRRGRRVAAAVSSGQVVAPELLDIEACSALARLERTGALGRVDADRLVEELASLPVERFPHAVLVQTAWGLRDRVRVADAFYVACATVAGAPLLTCDRRLSRAALVGVTVTLVQ